MLGAKLRSAPCFRGCSLGAEAHGEDANEEEAEVLGPSFPLRYRFSFRVNPTGMATGPLGGSLGIMYACHGLYM